MDQGKVTRGNILDEAKQIITHDRNDQYGEPEDVFSEIANLWTDYLDTKISKTDVAIMMALMKIARIDANPTKMDSWVDAIGYLAIGASFVGKMNE